jgi:long-chain acyl-CoA synthetase
VKIDFFDRLEAHARSCTDEIALQRVDDTGRQAVTFGRFLEEVRELGCFLGQAGFTPGSHVGLLMEEGPRWAVAFVGAYSAGLVLVPLDTLQEAAKLADLTAHAECQLLIVSQRYVDQARAILAANPGLKLLCDGQSEGMGYDWDIALPGSRPLECRLPLSPRRSDDDFVILYTGGTTGKPKGVRLSEANLFRTIWDIVAVCPVTAQDHILSILPLSHVMPLIANLLGPLYLGAKVTYLHSRDPGRILTAFREERITGFLCVPQFYYLLHRRIFEQVDGLPRLKRWFFYLLLRLAGFLRRRFGWSAGRLFFRQLHDKFGHQFRLFGIGAANFAPAVADTLLDLGFMLFQAYGLTETSGPVALTPPGIFGGRSCGPPVPHAEIVIHDPDARGIGDILIRSEQVTRGYWKDPEATAELVRDGWLWSGDVGYLDPDGCLHITGRKKEVIVLASGKNVFPEPVEYHLQQGNALIKEICVVAATFDPASGEHLHAIVVPDLERLRGLGIVNIHARLSQDIEIRSRSLPTYERVHSFEIRTEPLLRTSTGKLRRFEIRPNFTGTGMQIAHAAPDVGEPEVFNLLRQIKRGCGPIRPAMSLELDLGFDSLERVELFANIRQRFALDISEMECARVYTVGDLVALVDNRRLEMEPGWLGWPEILGKPLSDQQAAMARRHMRRDPLLECILYLLCRVVAAIVGFLLPLRAEGLARIPNRFPFIICANHASYLDAFLIASALPFPVFRRLFFLRASKYSRSALQRWLGRMTRALSIDADINLYGTLRLGAEGLRNGLVLCVFPEGHRSPDGELRRFRKGSAILAMTLNIPVLPVGVSGSHKVWGPGSNRIHRHPVHVRFEPTLWPAAAMSYDDFTEQIQESVRLSLASTGQPTTCERWIEQTGRPGTG